MKLKHWLQSNKPFLCWIKTKQTNTKKTKNKTADLLTQLKSKVGTSSGPFLSVYLLQLLGNTHARVHALPALGVFGFIVFQEVISGEFCTNEARQRRIWNNNNNRATVLWQSHYLQQVKLQSQKRKFFEQWELNCFIPGNMKNTLQNLNMLNKVDCDY